MPEQKPGRSVQDYATPRAFLDAVEARFGRIVMDLAAHAGNAVCARWFGPGGLAEDALSVRWSRRDSRPTGLLWLNPPFENIKLWAAKCMEEGELGARIAFLTPASVSAGWFARFVHGRALVLPLRPRLKFSGHTKPYPKDLMLSIFGPLTAPGFAPWQWFIPPKREKRAGRRRAPTVPAPPGEADTAAERPPAPPG